MPISIVVGGQFGSEGKGKVALEIVRRSPGPVAVARVGGPNSGHTAYDRKKSKWALRQMPAACIDRNVDVVFPAGSYLDVGLLLSEIEALHYAQHRVFVSPYANVIRAEHKEWERHAGLTDSIGSTGSGVGAAVLAAVARQASNFPLQAMFAHEHADLQPYISDTSETLDRWLTEGRRVVVEGSQGFGLSLLDGGFWPKATSRSTTAAAALAEAGLSPRYVDDVTMVVRAYPIRVAGDSGPMHGETTWEEIAKRSGRTLADVREFTTVTGRLRRVGNFDAELVKRAIRANAPHRLVLNHLDYVGPEYSLNNGNGKVGRFLRQIEAQIGRQIEWVGFSPNGIIDRREAHV